MNGVTPLEQDRGSVSGESAEKKKPIRVNKKLVSAVKHLQAIYESHSANAPETQRDINSSQDFLQTKGIHETWFSKSELKGEENVVPWTNTLEVAQKNKSPSVGKFISGADMRHSIDDSPNIDLVSDMGNGGTRKIRKEKRIQVEQQKIEEVRKEQQRIKDRERLEHLEKVGRVREMIRVTKIKRDRLMADKARLDEVKKHNEKLEQVSISGIRTGREHASLFYTPEGRSKTDEILNEWEGAVKDTPLARKSSVRKRVLDEIDYLRDSRHDIENSSLGRKKIEPILKTRELDYQEQQKAVDLVVDEIRGSTLPIRNNRLYEKRGFAPIPTSIDLGDTEMKKTFSEGFNNGYNEVKQSSNLENTWYIPQESLKSS